MSKGFPNMVQDLRGNVSAARYILDVLMHYNLHRPIIRDLTDKERDHSLFGGDDLVEDWF